MTSTSLASRTTQAEELVRSLDLQSIAMPDGALSVEMDDDKATVSTFRNIVLTLVVLPSEFLHTLQVGLIAEIKAQE